MNPLRVAGRVTLRDFLKGAPLAQDRNPPSRPSPVEGFIILDYIPALEELGEVIRQHRPVGAAPAGVP